MQAQSLYNGVAGVQSFTRAINSVADNLANINTVGYKATRTNFDDLLYEHLGMGNASETQVGNGSVASMQNLMNQSAFEYTDNTTDLAIDGNGFFMVVDPDTAELYYTRAGQFLLDNEGYLVNTDGLRLQSMNSADIQIDMFSALGGITTEVDLMINLDADADGHDLLEAIDPTDSSTYDYATSNVIYGQAQDLDADGDLDDTTVQSVTFYQKVEDYTGATPAGSSVVWKAAVYQYENGVYTPADGENEFYLHFDSEGHLIGTSEGGIPSGASYIFDGGTVSDSGQSVSNRLGESFSFTGDGSAQTIITSASLAIGGGGVTTGETVQIGTDIYTFAANLNQTDAAAWLADQINSSATGNYYAIDNGDGTLTLQSSTGATSYEITTTAADITVDQETSLAELTADINGGLQASGVINIPSLAALTDGVSTITVSAGGTDYTFTYDSGGGGAGSTFATLDQLAGHISDIDGLTATSSGGNVYVSADDGGSLDGTAGNQVTLASSEAAGTVNLSAATLTGGSDGSGVTDVVASVVTSTDGSGVTLQLERNDDGATATITGMSSTLGASLTTPLDYATATEQEVASDGSATFTEGSTVEITYDMGAGTTQAVTFDYAPENTTGSTTSAGSSEVMYVNQDGFATGYLYSLEIEDDGDVMAIYSNGETVLVDTIGLAAFINPDALTREGSNLWSANAAVGAVRIGAPGDDTAGQLVLGSLVSGALETSGVDVANEMVNMIAYQRFFQANSKAITTSDEMLKTAINLRT